ncbi:Ulp1 protease family protein [Colletotrichum tofieldiae]|nr:Ulp1 protease family protein [Colletotrichum tofieldiae]
MALYELLHQLNSHDATNESLLRVWDQLRQEFNRHPQHRLLEGGAVAADVDDDINVNVNVTGNGGFAGWALANVHTAILAICTDAQFSAEIMAMKPDPRRRIRAIASTFNVSTGVLCLLFGPKLVALRSAIDAFNHLIKACPGTHIADIHKRYTETASMRKVGKNVLAARIPIKRLNDAVATDAQNLNGEQDNGGEDNDQDSSNSDTNGQDLQAGQGERTDTPSPPPSTPDGSGRTGQDDVEASRRARDDQYGSFSPIALENPGGFLLESSPFRRLSRNVSVDRKRKFDRAELSVSSDDESNSYTPADMDAWTAPDPTPPPMPSVDFWSRPQPNTPMAPVQTAGHSSASKGDTTEPEAQAATQVTAGPEPKIPAHPSTQQSVQRKVRSDLLDLMTRFSRLDPTSWLDDIIMHTFTRRLESADVAVVDPLAIVSSKTDALRRRHAQALSKGTTIIPFNPGHHWVLYTWQKASGTLRRYDSLSDADGNRPPAASVVEFLDHVCGPDLTINFLDVEQPNTWDCGLFAIRAAEHLAAGQPLTSLAASHVERAQLRQAMLTSWKAALQPAEVSESFMLMTSDPRTRVRQLKEIRRRRTHLDGLSKSSQAYDLPLSLETSLRQLVRQEACQAHVCILGSIINDFHTRHIETLGKAIKADGQISRARERRAVEQKVQDSVASFLEAHSQLSALPADQDPVSVWLQSQYKIMEATGHSIQQGLPLVEQAYAQNDAAEETRRQASDGYTASSALLLVLCYACAKYRRVKPGDKLEN